MRVASFLIVLCVAFLTNATNAFAQGTPAAKQFKALLEEYEEEGGVRLYARKFLDFAEQHPKDEVSVAALAWVLERVRGRAETETAIALLRKHHLNKKSLGQACEHIAGARSTQAEALLRQLFDSSPHQEVRTQAGYRLGVLLETEAAIVEQLKAQPEAAPRLLQYYGKAYGQHLASLTLPELERSREELYERLSKEYADAEVEGQNLGRLAKTNLFRLRHLSVGKVAPEISGEDIRGKRMKLSDYRGKVILLTFWGDW